MAEQIESKRPHLNSTRCKYCNALLNLAGERTERRTFCKYKRPECSIAYRNFLQSLKNAKNSDSKVVKQTAKWINTQMKLGICPLVLKPILRVMTKTKGNMLTHATQ